MVEKKREALLGSTLVCMRLMLFLLNYWRFVPIIGGSFGVAKCTCSTLATTIL